MKRETRDAEFREFFLARAPSLRRTAFLVMGDWQHAEDSTQQALAKVYSAWHRIKPQTRVAYARKAVVNECLSALRRRRPEVLSINLAALADEAQSRRPHDREHSPLDVGSALALLPARQRAVIALRYLDDLSVAETAVALNVAEGTVKSHAARALATLRSQLPHLQSTDDLVTTPEEGTP